MINCENEFCIYNSANECELEEITINFAGICIDCYYPTIPTAEMKKYKAKTIKRLEEE